MVKIAVIGTRGFPGVQGGIENHCEQLYTRLAKIGWDITVFTRKPYVNSEMHEYKGVSLVPLDCPKSKFFETIVHVFRSAVKAWSLGHDILHVHGIGPSICSPLPRVFGMKVVVTHHGPDYRREKWTLFARLFLRFCECIGMVFANEVITITKSISEDIQRKFNRESIIIPNGVEVAPLSDSVAALETYGLQREKYILSVGRFVPEKGFHDLMDAFSLGAFEDWKLVIVGSADHEDSYSQGLRRKASQDRNVVLTGFLTGQPLRELYSHAGLFVIPSYYEGLPIVLLEAMSYGLSCIASDIPANRNVELSEDRFFPSGDVEMLSEKIRHFIEVPLRDSEKERQVNLIAERYNWDRIANQTEEIYRRMASSIIATGRNDRGSI
jgi:glycosyltransferase involved in cell wall biosynthesis